MQLDKALYESQAQARSLLMRRVRGSQLLELLEQACLIGGRNSNAGIAHRYQRFALYARSYDHDRLSGRGKLHRVREQIDQRLFQFTLIGNDVPYAVSNAAFKRQALARGTLANQH